MISDHSTRKLDEFIKLARLI